MVTKGRSNPSRDPDATRAKLVAAVGEVLARDGFGRLGVNAVARQAGVDKVLIYRYFGGLDGLMQAYGRTGDFWPTVEEMVGPDPEALKRLPLEEQVVQVMRNMIDGLRRRPLTHEILAWETVERNELTAILEEVRERAGEELFALLGDDLPQGVDGPALIALLVGGINYLLVRARKIRVFATVEINSDDGWQRLEEAVVLIVRRTFGPA